MSFIFAEIDPLSAHIGSSSSIKESAEVIDIKLGVVISTSDPETCWNAFRIERILSTQSRFCLGNLVVLVTTGVGFPVIDYAFHGTLTQVTHVDWVVGTMKTVLTFAGMGLVLYGIKVVDPRIQGLFRTFTPGVEPPAEDVARFWALRRSRKKHCQSCFAIALVILTITPVLRFYRGTQW
jgi:hypothetical protein